MSLRCRVGAVLVALAAIGWVNPLIQPVLRANGTSRIVATGLLNPRGLAFGPEGALYVAEAGSGGDGPCIPGGGGTVRCYGASGAITRISPLELGGQVRIMTGLPSLAPRGGFGADGPVDIAFRGRGNAHVVIGFGGDPAWRSDLGSLGSFFGTVLRVSASGHVTELTDVAAHEVAENPDGTEIDSNPYGLLTLPSRQVIADAGANALIEVDASGWTRTLAIFPSRLVTLPFPPFAQVPMQAVPTTVTLGPDGALYVGELTGFPFPVGGANIYRVPPQGGVPEVFASGFTNIIDVAFDRDGNLYVLEIDADSILFGEPVGLGALIRVGLDGQSATLATDLLVPAGLAIAPNGEIFVTIMGVFPGGGQVIRITPSRNNGA
jgi:sugar lactone lactonase YvrE